VNRALAAVEMALINSHPAVYVDDDEPDDPGPGDSSVSDPRENGSAEHPFDAIAKAIDYAFPGETIVLLDGRYSGSGNVNIAFGGRGITVRSENGPQNCIVDCLGHGRALDFQNGEGVETVLQGITITGGKGTNGAGIQIKGCQRSVHPLRSGSWPAAADCPKAGGTSQSEDHLGVSVCINREDGPSAQRGPEGHRSSPAASGIRRVSTDQDLVSCPPAPMPATDCGQS